MRWEKRSPTGAFESPGWVLKDEENYTLAWVDAVTGGWRIWTYNNQVFKTAAEAKAVALALVKMGELQ